MRGKKVDIDKLITNIEPYLKEGCSLHEACLHGIVPYTTVIDYYNNDEELRKKIDRLQNEPILRARESLNKGVLDNPELALRYLERKKKDEFSLKIDTTQQQLGADGKPIDKIEVIVVNSTNKDT